MNDPRQMRTEYERSVRSLLDTAARMKALGAEPEAIARTVHAERRLLASRFKDLTPEPLRSALYNRTLEIYGDPAGPTIEYLRSKGKSWEDIIESASRPGLLP
jgi:hypothetical protein